MIRDKKIEVRLTKEELEYLKYICNNLGISISDYIRQLMRGNTCNVDKRKIAMHIFNMQTFLNNIYQTGLTTDIIKALETEMNVLWQCLNW